MDGGPAALSEPECPDEFSPVDEPCDAEEPCRPGRFRRWVLRPVFWGLALVATLVFLLQLWVDTPRARERARLYLVEQLSTSLDRPVGLRGVRFNLLPFHVELWDLVIAGEPDGPMSPGLDGVPEAGPNAGTTFLRVPYTYIEADLHALQDRRIHLQLLRMERPEIDLRFYPGGKDNLIQGVGSSSSQPFEIWIDQVEIERADLALDHQSAEITVDAKRLRTRFRGLGDFRLAGSLSAGDVAVTLPESESIRVAVVAEGILERDHVRVDKARITNRHIDARASGSCEWSRERWQHRNCTFQTRGTARGAALRDLGYFRSLHGGFGYDGVFAWRPGAVGWRGRVEGQDLLLWGRRLSNLRGQLSADRFRVVLDLDRAEYSGGRLSGKVEADLEEPGDPITADLDFEDLHLVRLLSDQDLPVRGLAGRVDGHLLYTCMLNEGLLGSGHAEVELRPDPDAVGLPVEGSFPLRIEEGWVFADAAGVASQQRHSMLAVGAYHLDLARGRFDYEVTTADVSELLPIVSTHPESLEYLPTSGVGQLSGALQVETGFAYNTLSLDLEDVETAKMLLARVSGRLDVTPWALENLHLDLRHDSEKPEQTMVVRGRMPWSGAAGLTRLSFDAGEWPMDKVHPWIPFDLPVDGLVTGRLELELENESQRGEVSVSLTPARLTGYVPGGLSFDGLLAELSWDDHELEVQRLSAISAAGELGGRGRLRWPSGEMDMRLHSDDLDVGQEPFNSFLPRPDVHSTLLLDAHLAGTVDDPQLSVTLAADRLTVGKRDMAGSPVQLGAFWSDGHLEVSGELLDGTGLDGGGVLAPPVMDLEFNIESQQLARVIQLLTPMSRRVGGSLVGRLTLAGDYFQGPVRPLLELQELDLTIDGRRLVARPPLQIQLASDHWTIQRLHLEEPASDSRVEVRGRLGYQLASEVDLRTRAELDGTWLRVALPDLEVDGRLGLEGRVTGSLRRPSLNGSGSLEQGSLGISGLDEGFADMTGTVGFHGDRISLDRLSGRLSGGRAVLTGELHMADEGPASYRLDLDAEDVTLPSVEGWLLAGDAELALRSVPDGHLLSGRADLTRLDYREDIRFDLAQIVQQLLRGRRLDVEAADGLRSSIGLEVRIRADDTVALRNNVAELTGSADFQLRGNLAQPVLFGELSMDPGGHLVYNSTEYQLARGRLVFADPYRLEPEVDLVATTKVRDFEVTLALSGPMERLDARFSSEPPLPDVEVLRLLAGGDTYVDQAELVPDRTSELGSEQENSAATFLYGQAASAIGDRVNTLFGFDKFRIDPLTGSGDNLSKARFTVGKRLSKDVFLTYSVDPSSSDNQRIRVEWQLTDSLVLVLTQNGDDTFSADARWETTF